MCALSTREGGGRERPPNHNQPAQPQITTLSGPPFSPLAFRTYISTTVSQSEFLFRSIMPCSNQLFVLTSLSSHHTGILVGKYKGGVISWVKGSCCLVLKFSFPPFSPRLPFVVQISKQNTHRTFDPINHVIPVLCLDRNTNSCNVK